MNTTDRGGPALLGCGTLILGFVVGVVLIALGFTLIGIIVACGAIPLALAVWMTAGDRF